MSFFIPIKNFVSASFTIIGAQVTLLARQTGYIRDPSDKKFYDLQFTMQDNPTSQQGSRSAERRLRVYIELGNRGSLSPIVKAVTVFNYMRQFKDVPCGSVYDVGDLDLSDKTFTCTSGCQVEVREVGTQDYFR